MNSAERVLAMAIAAGLAACAAVPDVGPLPAPVPLASYAADRALAGAEGAWPAQHWWAAYGDPQLAALIEEALSGNPDLALAQARLRKAAAYSEQASAALLPRYSANASLVETKQSYNNGVPIEAVPKGWNQGASLTLDFSYELDFFGKNKAALQAALSQLAASRADHAQARLALATSVASAYAELLGQLREEDLAAESVRIRAKSADLVQQRQARGLETDAALGQARSLLASAHASLSAQRETILLQRYRIAALLGAGPDRGLAISRPAEPLLRPLGLPAELRSDLLGRRPDVLAARFRAEAAAAGIQQARAAFYPSVNLVGSIGQAVLGLENFQKSGSLAGSLGPAISLPLFDQGRLSGGYRSAHAEYQAAVASYNAAVTQALEQTASAIASVRALGEQLDFARRAQDEAERAYRAANTRYQGGLSTYLDVLSAENTLIAARRVVTQYQTRSFSLDIALVRALGGGFQQQS